MTEQSSPPPTNGGTTVIQADDASVGALGHQSEAIHALDDIVSSGHMLSGDSSEMHLPGDGYLVFADPIISEPTGTLDHALHQLTTATDLFDVPVIDFHSHDA
jgi:hypothetical protein